MFGFTAEELERGGRRVAELDGSDRLGCSAESHRIFGVPIGQFEGTSEAFFAFVHADDRQAVRAARAAAIAEATLYEIMHRIVRSDGSIRWVHECAHPVRDAHGRTLRMIG